MECLHHINFLKRLRIKHALQCFCRILDGTVISVLMDIKLVLSYIHRQGRMCSKKLCILALTIWEDCIKRQTFLVAAYLPCTQNSMVDFLSKRGTSLHKWGLSWTYFLLVFEKWVYIFATRPKKCHVFCYCGRLDSLSSLQFLSDVWLSAVAYRLWTKLFFYLSLFSCYIGLSSSKG